VPMAWIDPYKLEVVLILAGLVVWAKVVWDYLTGQRSLWIEPRPEADAIRFSGDTILLAVFAFFVIGQLVDQVLSVLGFHVTGNTEANLLSRQVVADTAGKILVGSLLFFFYFRKIGRTFLRKGQTVGRSILTAGVIYLAIFPLVNELILWLGVWFFDKVLHIQSSPSHQVIQLLNSVQVPGFVKAITLLLAAVISPIAEELFFRGILQNYLYKETGRVMPAILLTSFGFMLVHAPLYSQMPALGVLGIILGWSYYYYRTLVMPVLLHVLFNSATLVFWWLGAGE